MINISSVLFNNEFRTSQDLAYLLACIGEKVAVTSHFYYEDLTYASNGNTITLSPDTSQVNATDTTGMILAEDGIAFENTFVGDTVGVYNAGVHLYYTVLEKCDNGLIKTDYAGAKLVLTSGTDFVFNSTPFNGLRYAYNLVPNGNSYLSLIDGELQELTSEDLDCTNLTPIDLDFRGKKSYQIGSATIVGEGGTGGTGATLGTFERQSFKVVHNTVITPFFLVDQYADLIQGIRPDYFESANALNYIARLQLGRDLTNPNGLQELEASLGLSNTGWFNERYNGGINNYSVSDLVITNLVTSEVVDQLELTNEMQIEITVDNTVDSPFSNANTKYTFGFNYLPDSADLYDKNGFNQTRNFAFDSKTATLGGGSQNGDNFGNDLQIIKTVTSTYISATQMKVTVVIATGDDANVILQQGDINRYMFWLITENHSLDAAKSDKVNLLGDNFVNEFHVQTIAEDPVVSLLGTKFIQHPYEDIGDSVEGSDLEIFPVDDLVAATLFYIDYNPIPSGSGSSATMSGLINTNAATASEYLIVDVTNNKTIAVASWQGSLQATSQKLRDSINDNVSYGTVFGGHPAYVSNQGYNTATAAIPFNLVNFLAPVGSAYNGVEVKMYNDFGGSLEISNNTFAGGTDNPNVVSAVGAIITNIETKILLKEAVTNDELLLEQFDFSPANAPLVGDVQDIDFEQERVFKIPDDEIRKVIKCERLYALDTANLKFFQYLYPFMFRWEYWVKLITTGVVPSELFDSSLPNNGINHFWERYTDFGDWNLKYDITFTTEQNGIETVQTFTSSIADAHDFEDNAEWTPLTIITEDTTTNNEITVSGTKMIYGFEDCRVVASFTKDSGPLPVIGDCTFTVWIETYENGGIEDIRRISSAYEIGPDSWFKSTDGSSKLVVDKTSDVYTATCLIDYTKLPANKEYTIYARIYDEVKGVAMKQEFTLMAQSTASAQPPVVENPVNGIGECCFTLPALAEAVFTDELNNDIHSPIFDWGQSFVSAEMKLQKLVGSTWTDIATLNDNTYGTFNDFGFYFTMYDENKMGYEIEWALVLAAEGEGKYRVKCTGTDYNSDTIEKFSFEFCLKRYTAGRAEKTVKIDWWLSGNVGDPLDDMVKKDFGDLNWHNQIRFSSSKFGFDENDTTREFVKYHGGKNTWLQNSGVETYTLKTCQLPNEIRRFLIYDVLNGDDIAISDFNSDNANLHINRHVSPSGDFKPKYISGSKLAKVEVVFEQLYQNNDHKRS